jgi:hypothetical protein
MTVHAVQVAFERVQVTGPEPAKLSQPVIQLLKGFRSQPVEPALRVYRGFYKTGLAQHSQVLGYHGLRHTKLTLDLSHRLLRRDQEAQDRAAIGLGNDFEDRFHSLCILHTAYTCQGIYSRPDKKRPRPHAARVWAPVTLHHQEKCSKSRRRSSELEVHGGRNSGGYRSR